MRTRPAWCSSRDARPAHPGAYRREALIALGAGEASGALADFARRNQPAIQQLVEEAAENGWGEPLHLMT